MLTLFRILNNYLPDDMEETMGVPLRKKNSFACKAAWPDGSVNHKLQSRSNLVLSINKYTGYSNRIPTDQLDIIYVLYMEEMQRP